MGLGDGTTNDGDSLIRTLSSQLVGDKLVKPSSGNSVVLECRGFEKLDQIFDGGSEITTNAQFLQGNDHVLARSGSVLAVGENVTKLTVGETVDTTSSTDREVTPDV